MRAAHKALIPALALLAACSDPSAKSRAQEGEFAQPTRSAPTSAAAVKTSFAPVVKRAAPAVVNVYSKRTVRQQVEPMVEATVSLLREQMHSELRPRDIVVPCTLVERGTVRAGP